jgi:hypothetical protein
MSAPQHGPQPYYAPREGIAVTSQYFVLSWLFATVKPKIFVNGYEMHLNSDCSSNSSGDSGGNGGGRAQSTPIVMPSGQKPPPVTPSSGLDSTSTSTPPKPIVPVGSASTAMTSGTSATPTPIVTPQG